MGGGVRRSPVSLSSPRPGRPPPLKLQSATATGGMKIEHKSEQKPEPGPSGSISADTGGLQQWMEEVFSSIIALGEQFEAPLW